MSIKSAPFYTVICNWPECGHSPDEDGDSIAWAEVSQAIESAKDAGWWQDKDDPETWYCGDGMHPMWWASDVGDRPDPPYLLIHDGDTDNSLDDDGKVTLLKGANDG